MYYDTCEIFRFPDVAMQLGTIVIFFYVIYAASIGTTRVLCFEQNSRDCSNLVDHKM